ncbi:porphobilinogen deaminase [Cryptotrichosporon argae]
MSSPSTAIGAASAPTTFSIGTRRSNLALVQTNLVASALGSANPSASFPVVSMSTVGDRNQTTPLHLLSPYSSSQPAKSLWTDELEAALLRGTFDMLVHSCKDVPTALRDGCEIAALLEREDPRDALVVKLGLDYKSLDDLPDGSVVGTGSVRRVAQLKRAYPQLKFDDMRGNLNTRLGKLDAEASPFAALILATSGLERLGLGARITATLEYPVLLHAVGQGALAVEIRAGDAHVRDALRRVGHWQTEWRVAAERGLLRVLEGGCSVPVGVESAISELSDAASDAGADDDKPHYPADTFAPLAADAPTLHFSGRLDPATPFPAPGEPPRLRARRARLALKACVTSPDGAKHVLYEPTPAVVTSWQEAERWGEDCAREVRRQGAGEILDEIERVRKAREESDLEEAKRRSKAEAEADGQAATA